MHWVLDMEFDEDHSRARDGHSTENLILLRHLEINVLRADKSIFDGINRKRKELMWNDGKLLRVVTSA